VRRAVTLCLVLVLIVTACFATQGSQSTQGVDDYCYSQLSASEKIVYDAMFDCITTLSPKWNCGSFSQETLKKAYNCLILDHPELFWTQSFTYVTSYVNNSIAGRYVEFEYTMTRSEIEKANKEIEEALFALVREIGTIEPSYETVRKVYAWMVENCTYDVSNMDQSLYSVMVEKSGVCASFSKAFEFIMQCLGIPCTCVNGRLKNGSNLLGSSSSIGHEWNVVQIDGTWSHVDITSAISLSNSSSCRRIDYSFLCCTTEQMLNTHIIDNVVALPACDDDSFNVFKFYNLVMDDYDRDKTIKAFESSVSLGMVPEVRFSSYRTFLKAKEDLIDNAGLITVAEVLTSLVCESVEYTIDESNFSIRIF